MSYARCCDRYGGSPYVSIGEKVNNGTNLNKKEELMDLCPACMTELEGWLHIYDEEEPNDD